MSFALLSHTSAHAFPSSGIDTRGAKLIIVMEGSGSSGGGTLSDSKGNTWTPLSLINRGGGLDFLQGFYCINPTTDAAHTFSITGGNLTCICVGAFSAGAVSFDVQAGTSGTGGGTTHQGGSVTPANANSLVVSGASGVGGASALVSVDSGFTITDNDTGPGGVCEPTALAYIIETTIVAKNPTWTFSSGAAGWKVQNAVFYDVAALDIAIPLGAMVTASFAPNISKDIPIPPGTLTLATFAPVVGEILNLPIPKGSLVIATFDYTVSLSIKPPGRVDSSGLRVVQLPNPNRAFKSRRRN